MHANCGAAKHGRLFTVDPYQSIIYDLGLAQGSSFVYAAHHNCKQRLARNNQTYFFHKEEIQKKEEKNQVSAFAHGEVAVAVAFPRDQPAAVCFPFQRHRILPLTRFLRGAAADGVLRGGARRCESGVLGVSEAIKMSF